MEIIKFLQKEWLVVSRAPFIFITLAGIMFSLAYFVSDFRYAVVVESLKAENNVLKRTQYSEVLSQIEAQKKLFNQEIAKLKHDRDLDVVRIDSLEKEVQSLFYYENLYNDYLEAKDNLVGLTFWGGSLILAGDFGTTETDLSGNLPDESGDIPFTGNITFTFKVPTPLVKEDFYEWFELSKSTVYIQASDVDKIKTATNLPLPDYLSKDGIKIKK